MLLFVRILGQRGMRVNIFPMEADNSASMTKLAKRQLLLEDDEAGGSTYHDNNNVKIIVHNFSLFPF